jgi:hypothetical protein
MLELVMQVSRNGDNRLNGAVRLRQGSELHAFSGTLELLRVFEDLVPLVSEARPLEPAFADGTRAPETGVSGSPEPRTH